MPGSRICDVPSWAASLGCVSIPPPPPPRPCRKLARDTTPTACLDGDCIFFGIGFGISVVIGADVEGEEGEGEPGS